MKREYTNLNGWRPVEEPPTMTDNGDGWRLTSAPVLGFNKGNISVVYSAQDFDIDTKGPEGLVKWFSNCSEGWDITGEVTHWIPLPKGPE